MHRIALALLLFAASAMPLQAQRSSLDTVPVSMSLTAQPLQVGDAIRVAISREPTLSGDFLVDEDGQVALPLLGRLRASGRPWRPLRDSVEAAYRRELRAEAITLVPLRRVYVLGSVMRPGVYMLDPTFGLQGAISLAGGAGLEGNIERIRIDRGGNILLRRVALNTPPSTYEVRSGDQVFVERRSWIDRNSTLLLTSVISVAGIIVTLARRN